MNDNKQEIGLRIKNIRLNNSKNLREFGEEISKLSNEKKYISDSIVSRWEKGVSIPNAKRLKAIANYGNVTTNFLLYGSDVSYVDIEKNIKTKEMEKDIKENIAHFLRHYLYFSIYNSKNEKTGILLNLFLDKEEIAFENILDKMYSLISNDNYSFYLDGVFLLLNEKFEQLHVQIYLTEFIYKLLIQISFDFPDIYFENLLLQFDDMQNNIKEISTKREVYKNDKTIEKLAEFINNEEYIKILNKLDEIKNELRNDKIIIK